MCSTHDPITDLQCLREDQHFGEHVAIGRQGEARWTIAWHDAESIRAIMAAASLGLSHPTHTAGREHHAPGSTA